MKKLFATSFALLFLGAIFAQQTAHNPNTNPTITKEQVLQLKNSQNNTRNGVLVLTFEGLGNLAYINNFYNGGTDSQGNVGFNYGIEFQSGAAMGLIDQDAGGSGNFANEPSPSTAMFFLYDNSSFMNVNAGFTTGFSFYYSTHSYPGSVQVFDGLDGTGNLLGSANLAPLGFGIGDPNGEAYGNWAVISIPFAGTAKSVVFSGSANYIVFDDVTFGSVTPGGPSVPVSNWALYLGIFLIFTFIVIRFRRLV